MLYACFYTICLVFRYTSWHFYAFSETNLLMRCHSVSSLFSAVFVFQKSYTGNILRIGQNKSWTSRNLPKLLENRRGDRTEPGVVSPPGARPRAWPRRPMVSPTWSTSVISQHVGQLRGRIEGFCALHLKLRDFFALLSLKPKSDRISLREGMVNSRSAKEIDMTSFDLLLVGSNKVEWLNPRRSFEFKTRIWIMNLT
jgi:hypothetical protein